jgi:hypothetical protein
MEGFSSLITTASIHCRRRASPGHERKSRMGYRKREKKEERTNQRR